MAVKLFRLDVPPDIAHRFIAALERLIASDLTYLGIAAPLATGWSETFPYLAMDFVAADSFDVVIRDYGPAPVAEALRIATQLGGALDFAAAVEVYHGALHPRDVLVTTEDTRVTGLGIAQALESAGITAPVRRPYSAPERVAGQPWDRRADVFSLAALVWEMLCGRRIAGAGQEAVESMPDVPGADQETLRAVFARALADRPDDRFDTALAFVQALHDAFRAAEASGEGAPRRRKRAAAGARRSKVGRAPVVPLPLDTTAPVDEVALPLNPARDDHQLAVPEPESLVPRLDAGAADTTRLDSDLDTFVRSLSPGEVMPDEPRTPDEPIPRDDAFARDEPLARNEPIVRDDFLARAETFEQDEVLERHDLPVRDEGAPRNDPFSGDAAFSSDDAGARDDPPARRVPFVRADTYAADRLVERDDPLEPHDWAERHDLAQRDEPFGRQAPLPTAADARFNAEPVPEPLGRRTDPPEPLPFRKRGAAGERDSESSELVVEPEGLLGEDDAVSAAPGGTTTEPAGWETDERPTDTDIASLQSRRAQPPIESDPGRGSVWPIALALAVGVLVGFAGGFSLGSRDRVTAARVESAPPTAAVRPAPAAQPSAPGVPRSTSSAGTSASTRAEPSATATPAAPPPAAARPPIPAPVPSPGATAGAGAPDPSRGAPSASASARTPARAPESAAPTATSRAAGDPKPMAEPPATLPAPGRGAAPPTSARGAASSRAARGVASGAAAGREPSGARAEPGRITVRSTPAGAVVTVDGRSAGTTPVTVRDIARGSHLVRIAQQGYVAAERRVRISNAQPAQSIAVDLVAARPRREAPAPPTGPARTSGSLMLDSRPAGARVLVDGREVGTTPMVLESIEAGSHTVSLELDGFSPWTTTTQVTGGKQTRVGASLRGAEADESKR